MIAVVVQCANVHNKSKIYVVRNASAALDDADKVQ